MKSCRPIRAKTVRAKSVRIITSFKALQDSINAETMVFKPGITEMAFKARKTRKARKAAIPGIWLVFSLGVDWSPSLLFTTDPNVSIRISRYLNHQNNNCWGQSLFVFNGVLNSVVATSILRTIILFPFWIIIGNFRRNFLLLLGNYLKIRLSFSIDPISVY